MSGPKSAYNPKYHVDWAWSLAIKGATNKEIAEAFGISQRMFIKWYETHPELGEAVKHGKEIADAKVERALYQRAIGMELEDKECSVEAYANGKETRREKTVKKNLAPDTMAIMYWLNNRKRGQWSQKQEVKLEASTESDTDVVIVLPSNNRQKHIEGTVEISEEA